MVTIEKWFENKDYDTGYILLCRYSKNRVLLQNLGKKKNPAKLEYELTKYVKVQSSEFKVQSKQEPVPSAPISPPSSSKESLPRYNGGSALDGAEAGVVTTDYPDSLPPHLKAKWHFNQDSYKEIRALHEKLKLMEKATPEERQPLTERVASLDDKIRANWEVIDAWVPGAEPAAEPVEKPVMVDHKRINANRKFISSNLRKLETGNFKKHAADLISELQKRVTELIEAGEQMNTKTIEQLQKFGINN
jgi:hypothetical protein